MKQLAGDSTVFQGPFGSLVEQLKARSALLRIKTRFPGLGMRTDPCGILSSESLITQVIPIAKPMVSEMVRAAIAPFKNIREVAEIRVRLLGENPTVYVFVDMPTYSRALMKELVEAEHAALHSLSYDPGLRYEFYPLPMADPTSARHKEATVYYTRL